MARWIRTAFLTRELCAFLPWQGITPQTEVSKVPLRLRLAFGFSSKLVEPVDKVFLDNLEIDAWRENNQDWLVFQKKKKKKSPEGESGYLFR